MHDKRPTAGTNGNAPSFPRISLLTTAATALSALIVGTLVWLFYKPVPTPINYAFFAMDPRDFCPEPVERMQYLAILVTLPFAAYGWYTLLRKRLGEQAHAPAPRGLGWALLAVIALAVLVPLATRFHVALRTAEAFPVSLAAAFICAGIYFRMGIGVMERRAAALCGYAVLTAALFALAGTQLFGLQALDTGWDYSMHFSSVFHSVEEVWAGKVLLVDFINQYGLYPFFLAPVFKILGLSILKFTAVMAVLEVAAWLMLFMALRLLLKSGTLAAFTCAAALFICQMHPALLYHLFYFQGVPIRLLTSTAMVWLALLWFYKESKTAYWSCGICSALSVLWNFDTGMVISLTWTIALVYQEALRHGLADFWKPAARHLAVNIALLAAATGFFMLTTKIQSGCWPDFGRFFSFIRYFYGQGYFMIKMPLLHGWIMVALIYIAGLVHAAASLKEKRYSPQTCAVFLLSILGCGLFSYYQGRSVTSNLQFVAWPAIALAALALRMYGETRFIPARIAASVMAGALAFCAVGAASAIPAATDNVRREVLPALKGTDAPAVRKAAFILENTAPGEEVVILAYNAAAYHLYSGTKNPLRLPGMAELYLRSELDSLAATLGQRNYKVFLEEGVFVFHGAQTKLVLAALNANYDAAGHSADGMTLYIQKHTVTAKH